VQFGLLRIWLLIGSVATLLALVAQVPEALLVALPAGLVGLVTLMVLTRDRWSPRAKLDRHAIAEAMRRTGVARRRPVEHRSKPVARWRIALAALCAVLMIAVVVLASRLLPRTAAAFIFSIPAVCVLFAFAMLITDSREERELTAEPGALAERLREVKHGTPRPAVSSLESRDDEWLW
jgi:formate hydrogenlyase subunit 3/multisubunit Na+/H+ antiporter MnhD subunit